MSVLASPVARVKFEQTAIPSRVIFALWVASLVLLATFVGNPPVTRTQEARVLETSRQMLGHPLVDWLIPKLNGSPRLQKPPLTYWTSAAGFRIGGVNETAGRMATVLVGWFTLAVTYLGAKWIFGQRAGLIASAALLGSYFFYRHTRLAETDAPAMLFVTLAILAFWRAADAATEALTAAQSAAPGGILLPARSREDMPPGAALWTAVKRSDAARQAGWFHVAAVGIGLATLSKGAPGGFAALFLVALVVIERRWSLVWAFVRSGALVTLAIIALPWFVYIGTHAGWGTFGAELNNNIEGGDHSGSLFQYVPELFVATAPWCGLLPLALFAAIKQRRDIRFRRMLIWLLAIAVPLCIQGNKQKHYLLPLMPPLMILIGWLLDRAIDRDDGVFGLARLTVLITMAVTALAALGVLVASRVVSGKIGAADVIVSLALLSFAGLSAWLWRRQRASGIAGMLASAAVLMPLIVGLWAPSLAKMRRAKRHHG